MRAKLAPRPAGRRAATYNGWPSYDQQEGLLRLGCWRDSYPPCNVKDAWVQVPPLRVSPSYRGDTALTMLLDQYGPLVRPALALGRKVRADQAARHTRIVVLDAVSRLVQKTALDLWWSDERRASLGRAWEIADWRWSAACRIHDHHRWDVREMACRIFTPPGGAIYRALSKTDGSLREKVHRYLSRKIDVATTTDGWLAREWRRAVRLDAEYEAQAPAYMRLEAEAGDALDRYVEYMDHVATHISEERTPPPAALIETLRKVVNVGVTDNPAWGYRVVTDWAPGYAWSWLDPDEEERRAAVRQRWERRVRGPILAWLLGMDADAALDVYETRTPLDPAVWVPAAWRVSGLFDWVKAEVEKAENSGIEVDFASVVAEVTA